MDAHQLLLTVWGPRSSLPKFTTQWCNVLHFYKSRTNEPNIKTPMRAQWSAGNRPLEACRNVTGREGSAVQTAERQGRANCPHTRKGEPTQPTAVTPRPRDARSTLQQQHGARPRAGHTGHPEALLTLGSPEHCRGSGSTPGLYPVDTSNTQVTGIPLNVPLKIQSLFLSTACQESMNGWTFSQPIVRVRAAQVGSLGRGAGLDTEGRAEGTKSVSDKCMNSSTA